CYLLVAGKPRAKQKGGDGRPLVQRVKCLSSSCRPSSSRPWPSSPLRLSPLSRVGFVRGALTALRRRCLLARRPAFVGALRFRAYVRDRDRIASDRGFTLAIHQR